MQADFAVRERRTEACCGWSHHQHWCNIIMRRRCSTSKPQPQDRTQPQTAQSSGPAREFISCLPPFCASQIANMQFCGGREGQQPLLAIICVDILEWFFLAIWLSELYYLIIVQTKCVSQILLIKKHFLEVYLYSLSTGFFVFLLWWFV